MNKKIGIIVLVLVIVAVLIALGTKTVKQGEQAEGSDPVTQTTTAPTAMPTENPEISVEIVEPTAQPTTAPTTSATAQPSPTPASSVDPTATPTPAPVEQTTPAPTTQPEASEKTEYEKYIELSGAEQQKIFESFSNPQEFFDWYNKAKEEYEEKNQAIIVDGGSIDLGDFMDEDK